MLFIGIFLLLFSNYSLTNSLKCMSSKGDTLIFTSECQFSLDINNPIPDDADIISTTKTCAMKDADSLPIIKTAGGSCYGEIEINYYTLETTVKLTGVSYAKSFLSPYDDMLGFYTILNGKNSVIQYKINGNFDNENILMTTRIQCTTYDNCALDKLRKLLANLTVIDIRKNRYKELVNFLNTPDSDQQDSLTCADNADDDVQCNDNENQCRYDRSKNTLTKGCAVEDATPAYDLEYRFNIIDEMEDPDMDNSAKALKCFYLCKTDLCNSEANFARVDNLLHAFALAEPTTPGGNTDSDSNQPAPQINPKPKSDSVLLTTSFSSRTIIIFYLFIQILSN